ncbi:hypothetical protein HYV70_02525 [Candidatus Uhrbacteria bacterium]|nr:hypothetical protein [Candidatus Uhrbacteria bacterium]
MAKKVGLSNRDRQTALVHATFNHGNSLSGNVKKVPGTFSDTTSLQTQWFLENTQTTAMKDALLIQQVLMRMVRMKKTQRNTLSEPELLEKLVNRLIKIARPEIISYLEETEKHHLYFNDLNQMMSVFSWIQKKVGEELGYKGGGRQIPGSNHRAKDDVFWKNVYSMSCQLFGFFQDHWGCFCTEKEAVPIQSAQITIRAFEIIYKLMSTVPPCKVLRLVQSAHQARIDLQQIERIALSHIPMRIDDFIQLMADKILTPKTSILFLKYPELIDALSYEGIRHLFRRWKESERKTNILVFAQSIRQELYPDTLPDGIKTEWEILEHPRLFSFLHALHGTTQGEISFSFPDHAYAPGLYTPSNAMILLPKTVPMLVARQDQPLIQASPRQEEGEYDYPILDLDEDENESDALTQITCIQTAENFFCEEVFSLWTERAEAYSASHENPCLLTSKSETSLWEESADVENPWDVVIYLIEEDLKEKLVASATEDPDLVDLMQEMQAVHRLLNFARAGDAEGVLDCWASWIDPIRGRIKKLDGRLKQTEKEVTISTLLKEEVLPISLVEECETEEMTVQETPAVSLQIQEPSPVQELTPSVEIPAESQLVTQTRELLAKLPVGSMRKQLKKKLDTLIGEATQGEGASLKAAFTHLQGEIQSLLDVIS